MAFPLRRKLWTDPHRLWILLTFLILAYACNGPGCRVRIGVCHVAAKKMPWSGKFHAKRIVLPRQKLVGTRDRANRLARATKRYAGSMAGPESLAWDSSGGGPYASVSDGRILKRRADDSGWDTFAWASADRDAKLCDSPRTNYSLEDKCGRPVGLAFHPTTGDLYFCDTYFGLFKVGSSGGVATKLVDTVDGKQFLMTNDLDIDADANVVYFTDASARWHSRDFLPLTLEGQTDGRFMKFDIATGDTAVIASNIAFANGVAISQDKTFVVFCETTYCRCHRYWIRGSKAGKTEVFVNLPGFPDNLSLNPRGRFWIALNSRRSPATTVVGWAPWLREKLVEQRLGYKVAAWAISQKASGIIVEVDRDGNITDILEDRRGKVVRSVSEVVERDKILWLGSVISRFVATVPYEALSHQ